VIGKAPLLQYALLSFFVVVFLVYKKFTNKNGNSGGILSGVMPLIRRLIRGA
jgi:uncharacterized membrane protein